MLNSLQNTWRSLSLVQRGALVAVLAVVFGGTLLVTQMASRPTYAVLFSNMEAEDAGAITEKLRELKVEYRLGQGGRAIEVPADKVYDLRLSLATEGLPRGGSVGFELFDKPSFGATDFTQRLNYQRALQGELARTINRLEGVADSRVHVAIPERRLFSQEEQHPTASVVLHLKPGWQLDERRVAGVVHLVSSSVEGLKAEGVTVHDQQGNLLSSTGTASPMLTSSQAQQQERYERRLETELRQLADQVLGPGKAAIRVSAEMDWDQTETTSETYEPSGPNGRNLPVEEESSTEMYGRKGAAAGGAAGTAALPNARVAGTGLQPGEYTNSRAQTRYAVNKVIERRVTAPGTVKRVSVAVLLDQSVNVASQTALRDAFAAAAGLDLQGAEQGGRGDRIELLPMPFDTTVADAEKRASAQAAQAGFQTSLIRNGAAVLIVALIAGFSLLLLRRLRSTPRRALDMMLDDALPLSGGEHPALAGARVPRTTIVEEGLGSGDAPIDRMRQLASENPEEVARQLQLWIAAE